MNSGDAIQRRFEALNPFLDQRTRRLTVAAEAQVVGFGGISLVASATGVARDTISRGLEELKTPAGPHSGGIRHSGGGRKRTIDVDSTLREDLEKLIDPTERGDPESPPAVDLEESSAFGEGVEAHGASDESSDGGRDPP